MSKDTSYAVAAASAAGGTDCCPRAVDRGPSADRGAEDGESRSDQTGLRCSDSDGLVS